MMSRYIHLPDMCGVAFDLNQYFHETRQPGKVCQNTIFPANRALFS